MASSHHGSRARLSLECPFDLETVFTLNYSTEGLKGVLKWIIDNLNNVDTLLKSKVATIDK